MKVFLSWSGETSRQAAHALYQWLPTIIQTARPYMSAESIDKGQRWSFDIATELEQTHFGVICVTPENKQAPWILFEAGALSKSLEHGRVSPLTFGIAASDFANSPLLQFQFTLFRKDDVRKLLYSMNDAAPEGERLQKEILDRSFERGWQELEDEIGKIKFRADSSSTPDVAPASNLNAALDELLTLARSQMKILRSTPAHIPSAPGFITPTISTGIAYGNPLYQNIAHPVIITIPNPTYQRVADDPLLLDLAFLYRAATYLTQNGAKRDQYLYSEMRIRLQRLIDSLAGNIGQLSHFVWSSAQTELAKVLATSQSHAELETEPPQTEEQ